MDNFVKSLKITVMLLIFFVGVELRAHEALPKSNDSVAQSSKPSSPSDLEIQQMAVNTVAQMATNLINIGANPHNPQHVGAQVVSLLGSFVNFVTYAMRHPEILELVDDGDFKDVLRSCLQKKFQEPLGDEFDEQESSLVAVK